jgi:hypothetical protein
VEDRRACQARKGHDLTLITAANNDRSRPNIIERGAEFYSRQSARSAESTSSTTYAQSDLKRVRKIRAGGVRSLVIFCKFSEKSGTLPEPSGAL